MGIYYYRYCGEKKNGKLPLIYGLKALSIRESAIHIIFSFYVACALVVHF